MNDLLTAEETLRMLRDLRASVRRILKRESELQHEKDQEQSALRRRYELLKSRSQSHWKEEARQRRAISEKAYIQCQNQIKGRAERIQNAFVSARLSLEKFSEQIRTQQQYENQKELLRSTRQHDEKAADLERDLKVFSSQLEEWKACFEEIEMRIQKAYSGYVSFRRCLHKANYELQTNETNDLHELHDDEFEDDHNVRNDEFEDVEFDDDHTIQKHQTIGNLQKKLAQLEGDLRISPSTILARLHSVLPIWLLMGGLFLLWMIFKFVPQISEGIGGERVFTQWIGGLGGGFMLSYLAGYWLGKDAVLKAGRRCKDISHFIKMAHRATQKRHQQTLSEMDDALSEVKIRLSEAWKNAQRKARDHTQIGMKKLEDQRSRLLEKNSERGRRLLSDFDDHAEGLVIEKGRMALKKITAENEKDEAEIRSKYERENSILISEWRAMIPVIEEMRGSLKRALRLFPDWNSDFYKSWKVPEKAEPSGSFGMLEVDLDQFVEMPSDVSFSNWTASIRLSLPLIMKMPSGPSLLIETENAAQQDLMEAFNAMILRLLSTSPLGLFSLTLIDPVGLGRNFAALMHLADHDDRLINRRIWTQKNQIETCLYDLTEHMEKVMQMFLRNEYDTLAEYNSEADIAEKYHMLIVADFPNGFSETALSRLQSIATNGRRCGVFLILHRDKRQPIGEASVKEDLRKHALWIEAKGGGYLPGKGLWKGVSLRWEKMASSSIATHLVKQIGEANVNSHRVKLPFRGIAPSEDRMWSLKTEAALRVPIGRSGASKLQHLTLGKGTQQHALIAGKTGSGKSTLFHVMITNLSLWCAPDQVEFYLVDFKKGVEFKCYSDHHLPHARVIAIESDREFGLSVLSRIDQELQKRGELFRKCGVQDLASYHREKSHRSFQTLPRTLLLIDEFQEYFVEEDAVSHNAAVLLDRIVRQGRAFGIHVILGSQTLGGAYTLARTTLSQMVIRIALQCDESDSYLILDENNSAARLLTRPGEGIYNDSGGLVEGNSPFQTAWLSDVERERCLEKVNAMSRKCDWKGDAPLVFEGNAPARIEENHELERCLSNVPKRSEGSVHAWLGAAGAIKGPTCATFDSSSASHLLIIGQNEEAALSLVICSLISLASQYQKDDAEFVILDVLPESSPQKKRLDEVIDLIPQPIQTLRNKPLDEIMGELGQLMNARFSSKTAPMLWLVIVGLHSFKALRHRDEFGFSSSENQKDEPAEVLERLITEGASCQMGLIASIDSYNNSQRFLGRKALSEIEMRVLFQMSVNDSAALIDSTEASRLGLYRAIFSHERKGFLEVFRPYSMPSKDWISKVKKRLDKRIDKQIEKGFIS